jgi:FtsH-binding integral membrane protein
VRVVQGGYGGNGGWMQLLYAGGGCLLFSFYLVYDTQLILGGQHKKYQFSVDDYVFAALNLYLDIINLFIFILQILGSRD